MTDIYHAALKQSTTDLDVAEVKYSIVRQALSKAREKFKMRESVKTPKPIPVLLKEAADAGLPEARTFVNSTQGKAASWLRL